MTVTSPTLEALLFSQSVTGQWLTIGLSFNNLRKATGHSERDSGITVNE